MMAAQTAGEVTQLLVDWSNGDREAEAKLMPVVYDELRKLAARYLKHERSDHTLQTTALVHEAYLRLVDQRRVEWRNSLHFYALAASMMRRILVDHARSHRYAKRGGGARKLSLDEVSELSSERAQHLVAVDDALSSLAEIDPELSKIVELRFFGGLENSEVAELLGVSVPTVVRRWRTAKAWLYRYLDQGSADAS
ncbi:MAG: sigma-70 family RNA polymerase sigma factor [Thermoanaerobaculia bacterium]